MFVPPLFAAPMWEGNSDPPVLLTEGQITGHIASPPLYLSGDNSSAKVSRCRRADGLM